MSLFDSEIFNQRMFFPRPDTSATPVGADDQLVEVPEARLHLRCHGSVGRQPSLLLFHGNGEVVADYDDAAGLFSSSGVCLAVVDFRGYGMSSGVPTLRTVMSDAPRVLDAVLARGRAPLVVMGRSLGSACANELYGRAPPAVAGFVLESGFVDLRGLIERRGLVPPDPLDPTDCEAFDPLPKLRRGQHPLLVLHGGEDTLIPPDEARAACAAAGAVHKQLVVLPGVGHNDIGSSRAYWTALAEFVRQLASR